MAKTKSKSAASPVLWALAAVGGLGAAYLSYGLLRADTPYGPALGPDRLMAEIDTRLPLASDAEKLHAALAERPVDGRIYRALAVVTADQGDMSGYSRLIETAVRLDPRDRRARVYRLEDHIAAGNADAAVEEMDAVMRMAPAAIPVLVTELAPVFAEARVHAALSQRMASDPAWKPAFIGALAGVPGQERAAYAYWSKEQGMDPAQPRLYDPGFERDPGNTRFDWRLPDVPGIDVSLSTDRPLQGARSLRLDFHGRAVNLAGPIQDLVLSPGSYRLKIEARDHTDALRPFAWTVRCLAEGGPGELGRAPFGGEGARGEQSAELRFAVPAACPIQRLSLINTARTTLERQISGELVTEVVNFSHQ